MKHGQCLHLDLDATWSFQVWMLNLMVELMILLVPQRNKYMENRNAILLTNDEIILIKNTLKMIVIKCEFTEFLDTDAIQELALHECMHAYVVCITIQNIKKKLVS